jgi:very-short-patch-repair endonuclease
VGATKNSMRNAIAQSRAKELRSRATNAEQYLWQYLRRRQLAGYRFRRQVPIGNYIADFACLEAALVVELDGGQHQQDAKYDERRDHQIAASGFRVLRFWDNEVFEQTQAVLETILGALETGPHPSLPPPAGEGK